MGVATPEQVRRLVALYDGAPRELVALLAGQFAVLKQQAQSILGISGLCITVTGFSGHNMVRAGPIPTGLMVAGVGVIFLAIVFSIRVLASIHWVSQDLSDPFEECVTRIVERRDRQQRTLVRGGVTVAVGLALYTAAVMLAALSGSEWTPP